MIKGTTPTFTFELAFDASNIVSAYLTFQQGTSIVIEKDMSSALVSEQTISFELSQEDTLKLADYPDCVMQLRFKTNEGKVIGSKLIDVPVIPALKTGEI